MQNCKMTVKGDKLTIEVDLKAAGRPSSTGKTQLVATTGGAQPIAYEGRDGIKVALNVTVPA